MDNIDSVHCAVVALDAVVVSSPFNDVPFAPSLA